MHSRRLLTLVAVITAGLSLFASAQPSSRQHKVAILSPGAAADTVCLAKNQGGGVGCFVDALRALVQADGRRLVLEFRFAEGDAQRLPALAAELVALRPDAIYTFTTAGAEAAVAATTTIPIVVGPAGERTLERLAGNLARPQGNLTGLTLASPEQDQKCLQLLKELAPRTARVAVILNPANSGHATYLDLLRPAATQLGMTLVRIDARNDSELPQAFAAIRASGADAILIADDLALAGNAVVRQHIAQWALRQRLPVASASTHVAADGGLVSLGTDNFALVRRAAYYVNRILLGAKPAELPVERPTTYKLSINRASAKALGLTIPQSLLLRADEVIQ